MSNIKNKNRPSFIIIGAPRSGTTSAFFHLNKHKNVRILNQLNFFNSNDDALEKGIVGYRSGINAYNNYFKPGSKSKRGVPLGCKKRCVGERTTEYYRSDKALYRLKEHYPDIKIIVIIREPVSRARSLWNHRFQKGRHKKCFKTWICSAYQNQAPGEGGVINLSYYDRLSKIFSIFPRDNVHVEISELIMSNPLSSYNNILNFIEQKPFLNINFDKTINKRLYSHDLEAESFSDVYNKFFKEDNSKLYSSLGYEIRSWEGIYAKL